MCLSCGCLEPEEDHDDARNITLLLVNGAAQAAGITPQEVATNIVNTLAATLEKAEAPSDSLPAEWATSRVLKAQEERRFTLGLAYPANRPDIAKAADGHRDFASAEVVEATAWAWMAKSRQVGLFHADGTEGHGTVVESAIYRGPDWTITATDGSEQVIKAGDWLCGVQWDEQTWPAVKAGFINGFSPQGSATRRPADAPPDR